MLNRLTENKPLIRKMGTTCLVLGSLLLVFILLNMFVVTWVQVGPGYLPLILVDIVLGIALLIQSKEE